MFEIREPSKISGLGPMNPNFSEKTFTFPSDGKYIPEIKPKSVLLPEPFGPIINVWEFFGISKFIFSKITSSELK